ncbi:MAG: hypothetical protein JNK82_36670 [Myxococcaceae bacterium]|nr:hypothetical protein [Myxococcaceae bacterium]
MRRALLLCCLCACDGVVGELGEAEALPAPLPKSAPRIGRFECTPSSGFAPLETMCRLEVTHPDGKPASCGVDPGTGATATRFADCLEPQTFSLRFAEVGTFMVRAVATDPDEGSAASTVSITTLLRPNVAPVIDDFSAAPSSGGAPFTSTLTWRVSDADGDALMCKLNDVTVDCASGTAPFPVMSPGTVTVTLTVTDAKGESVTRAVTLTAVMPVGDVRISRVEYGQSVIATDLRLVGQKPALLRVHVLADRANLSGITVEAAGRLGATDLGRLVLTGPATVPTAEVPADLTRQWSVTLPIEWVEPNVEITVRVDTTNVLPETDEANNVQVLRPAVGRATVMQLTSVPVMHQGMTPTVTSLDQPMTRVWPLKQIASTTRAPYMFGGQLSGGATGAWGDLLEDIAQLRQMDGSNRNYYGFVRVSYGSGVAGIGFIGQEASVGRDDSISTAQHELGHNMGRNHAPCGGAAGADGNYPYPMARIGSWGYDAVQRRLMPPTQYVDLMSYCSPEWISDYNYRAVQRFLEAAPYVAPSGPAPNVTSVAISGHFGPNGVKLRPVHRVRASPSPEPKYTGRHLRVVFASGRERVVPIDAHEIADLEVPEYAFFALVEDWGAIASIEVLVDGAVVLAEHATVAIEATPAATATRLSENELLVSWDAGRYPKLAIAHLGPTERTTLALALAGGSAIVRVDGLKAPAELELSLSTGLDAARVVVPMPGH